MRLVEKVYVNSRRCLLCKSTLDKACARALIGCILLGKK